MHAHVVVSSDTLTRCRDVLCAATAAFFLSMMMFMQEVKGIGNYNIVGQWFYSIVASCISCVTVYFAVGRWRIYKNCWLFPGRSSSTTRADLTMPAYTKAVRQYAADQLAAAQLHVLDQTGPEHRISSVSNRGIRLSQA